MACRQTGFLLSEYARIIFGVAEAVHCTDLCGFDSHRLTELLTKNEMNYDNREIYDKSQRFLRSGVCAWCARIVGVLRF